jgi:hypothetical protein
VVTRERSASYDVGAQVENVLTAVPVCCADETMMSRSGFGYCRGRHSTPYATEKIAVLRPMPSASVARTVKVNAGPRRINRSA